jgi:hypothetical protein
VATKKKSAAKKSTTKSITVSTPVSSGPKGVAAGGQVIATAFESERTIISRPESTAEGERKIHDPGTTLG